MNGVEIPWQELSSAALTGLIEAFVMREGTDYGEYEVPLADKVEQVRQQVERGDVRVLFDLETESATLVSAASLAQQRPAARTARD